MSARAGCPRAAAFCSNADSRQAWRWGWRRSGREPGGGGPISQPLRVFRLQAHDRRAGGLPLGQEEGEEREGMRARVEPWCMEWPRVTRREAGRGRAAGVRSTWSAGAFVAGQHQLGGGGQVADTHWGAPISPVWRHDDDYGQLMLQQGTDSPQQHGQRGVGEGRGWQVERRIRNPTQPDVTPLGGPTAYLPMRSDNSRRAVAMGQMRKNMAAISDESDPLANVSSCERSPSRRRWRGGGGRTWAGGRRVSGGAGAPPPYATPPIGRRRSDRPPC